MARSPLSRLLRGSLSLPGALLDALRPRPAAPPEPLLLRLRSVLERFGEDESAPVSTTYSEVRLYGGLRPEAPGTTARALAIRGSDPLARDFAAAREQLAAQLGVLGGAAREIALAVADRLDDDLAGFAAGLDGLALPRRSRRKRQRAVARLGRLLEVARSVEVDPARGRRRDLKRLARKVRRLRRLGSAAGIPRRAPRALAPRR
jgi:hypothetical protein